MDDGSVIVVEIAGGTLTRVNVDTGDKEVVAEPDYPDSHRLS